MDKSKATLSCSISIESAVDRTPLLVAPDTPLITVIKWMSQGKTDTSCPPKENTTLDTSTLTNLPPKRTSYALVAQASKLIGIITERDIVKLTAQGTPLNHVSAANVMQQQLITAQISEIQDGLTVLGKLRQHRIRHLPVLNDKGHITGVVTSESIRRTLQPSVLLKLRQIDEVMAVNVVTAPLKTPILKLAALMATQRVSCVVITDTMSIDNHNNHNPGVCPVGIVTERDIVQFQVLGLDVTQTQAQTVMSTPLSCLRPNTSLWEAHQKMQELLVRRLVITNEQGFLAGILTQTSFLSLLDPIEMCSTVDILEQQVNQLQDEKIELLQALNQSLSSQVQDSEARFQTTFEQAAAGIVHVSFQGRFLQANQRFCEMIGYSQADLLTKTVLDVTHPDDQEHDLNAIQRLLQGEVDSFSHEKRYCRSDGITIWGSVTVSRIKASQNNVGYLVAVIEDISRRKKNESELALYRNHLEDIVTARTFELECEIDERKRIEKQLFQEKELAQVTLQSIQDAVVTTDESGHVTYLNPVAEQLTGWSHHKSLGKPLTDIFIILDETTREPQQSLVEKVLQKGGEEHKSIDQTLLISKDGTEYGISHSAAPLSTQDGQIIGTVMVFRDVTQARYIERQLSWQASHDALTNLVNRRKFEQILKETLQFTKQEIEPFKQQHVLCYLDLDHFKIVNDTGGHSAGDKLLKQVSALLSRQIRVADTLARLGGDEFAILLYQCPIQQAILIANQILTVISEFQFIWDNRSFKLGISIGLTAIDVHHQDIEKILNAADTACYQAKAEGRNQIYVYKPSDQSS